MNKILPFTVAALLAGSVGCGDSTGTGGGDNPGGGDPGAGCEPAAGCPTVESDCVAFTDNAGLDTFALRITSLNVESPAALTDPTVTNLLTAGITYDYPECTSVDGLTLFNGDGTFNWIFQFDVAAGTLTTGGAELNTDPNAGYCFLDETIAGFDVSPLNTTISVDGGAVEITETADVVVPIFTNVDDPTKVILLPLRSVRIYDTTISDDNNCIGSFNDALDPNNLCLPDNSTPTFVSGGKLEGYITLEDADAVLVPELGNASLCSLLAGAKFTDQETKACTRVDGEIEYQGDWCAGAAEGDPGTAATADCADAVKLAAGFAASAVTLRSDCN